MRVCELTGKRRQVGYSVSHAHNKNKKIQQPNIHRKRIFLPEEKRWIKLTLSTRAIRTINKIGLKRNGFDRETITNLENAFRIIFRTPELLMKDALEQARSEFPNCPEVQYLIRFFEQSKRGVVKRTVED